MQGSESFRFYSTGSAQDLSSPVNQGSPPCEIECLMTQGGADAIIIEIKCTMNALESSLETIPLPQSVEKCSTTKLVPGAKKLGTVA